MNSWYKIFQFSGMDIVKILVTALLIVIVTKVQIINDRISALLIALPFTSLIAMIWMYYEKQSSERLANHAEGTFWFVLPTLPMFLIMPYMLRHGWSFWTSLLMNCLLTVMLFWITVFILRILGINLIPK